MFDFIYIYFIVFAGSHKGVNGMLRNGSFKSNPNLSIPLNIDVENKVILFYILNIFYVYYFIICY